MNKCKIENCNNPIKSKCLCSLHYGRLWLHGNPLITKPRGRAKIEKIKLNCKICDKEFEVFPSGKNKYKCCSSECGYKYRKISPNKRIPIPWDKKRWVVNRHGYIVCYHQGKEIKQHRWVMEQHLGRKLYSNEFIHHKNKIKTDNRIENLQIVNLKEHTKIHWDELKTIQEENDKLKKELNLLKVKMGKEFF